MTQKEHDEAMKKLRLEFEILWQTELEPQMKWRAIAMTSRLPVRDLAWTAFTHGKIPVVDKD